MKKKFFSFLIALCFILPSLFLLVGCGKDPVIYKINFYSDGAIYQTVEIREDKSFEMPTDPTKEGYTFDGWYFDNSVWTTPLTAQSVASMNLTQNLNVYARWQNNICTVDFYADNVKVSTKNVDIFTELTDIPSVTEKDGYTGVWSVTDFSSVSRDTRVDAVYTANTYIITFNYNGAEAGNDTASKVVSYDSAVGALPTPTKEGYIFGGWYLSNVKYTSSTIYQIVNNITLEARWTMEDNGHCIVSTSSFDVEGNSYEFVVDQENQVVELSSNIRYSSEASTIDFKNTFTVSPNATWSLYSNSTCTNAIATRTVSVTTTNVCYILVENTSTYEQTIYTVNLKKNRMFNVSFYNFGESLNHVQVEEGFMVEAPETNPESGVNGYAFKCWSSKELACDAFDFSAPVTSSKNLYACYENPNYIISEGLKFTKTDGKAQLSEVTDLTIENLVIPQICYTNLYYGAVEGVLNACTSLKSITIPFVGTSAAPTDNKESLFGILFGGTEIAGSTSKTQYYGSNSSLSYKSYIPNGLTSVTLLDDVDLAESTFRSCSMLTSITLAENTVSLGDYSLLGSGIDELVLPESVTTLGTGVYSASELIKIPSHVTTYVRDSIRAPFVFYYTADGSISAPYEYSIYAEDDINKRLVVSGKELIIENGKYYIIDSNNNALFCYCDSSAYTEIIPETVQGYPVTGIYSAVEMLRRGTTNIYIPDSVEEIYSYAFADYKSGSYSSQYKISQTVTLYFNSTSRLDYIGRYAFYEIELGEIDWPSSLRALGSYAFAYANGSYAIFKDGLESIGYRVFEGCGINVIYLPSTITSASSYLFDKAYSTIFMYGYGSRWNESYWMSYTTSATNCKFSVYETIEEVKIINGGVYARYGNFYRLYGVLDLDGAENFVLESEIDGYEVSGINWTSFSKLIISFDSFSLGDNTSVTSIHTKYIKWMKTFVASASFKTFTTYENSEYVTTSNSTTTTIDLTKASDVTMEKYAFKTAKKLNTIINPAAISGIGTEAFYGCTSLTSIDFTGATFTKIYSNTFYGCTKLASIVLPETLTEIGSGAFTNCAKLTSVVLPATLTAIGANAFKGCSLLTSVEFKDTTNWYVIIDSSESKRTVTNASTNASYLINSTTCAYEWTKKTA